MTELSANYTGQYDDQNKPIIDKSYYKNIIQDKFTYYLQALGYDQNKLTSNHLNAIFAHIQEDIFKPHNKPYKTASNCNIPYSQTNIEILLNIYTTICRDYVCIPSLYGFSLFTGIQEDTIKQYVTASSMEILNARKEYIRNKLADNNLGVTVLANNDTSIGLLYTRQNAIETQAIRQGLSLSDLKPIGIDTKN